MVELQGASFDKHLSAEEVRDVGVSFLLIIWR
jgi:hypothetical protein